MSQGGKPGTDRTGPMVKVSWGELVDKLTILEIKTKRLTSAAARANVQRELTALETVMRELRPPEQFVALKRDLAAVNKTLWDIEDQIRAKEAKGEFDARFVELARSVYINNDKRANLKREINKLLKSDLIEEKQYTSYVAD